MLIPKETIQDAKEKLGDGNADLIAQILELKEYDQKNMRSLCPFHEEKTPSFIYDTKRHCFHCFGKCGINVDAVTAYMHTGMTYVEACKEFFEQAKVKFAFGEHKVKTKKQYKYPVGVPINDKKIIYKYLGLRQISKETIDYCDVREDKHGNVVFNFYDSNDTLTLVKYRPSHAIDKTKGEIKCWCEKDADTANILFNMNRINVSEPLLVTEGECFPGYTEVLTKDGWLRLDEYDGQEVMQINDSLNGDFVRPLAYIKKEYSGDILSYNTGGNYEQATTPGHNLVYTNKKTLELCKKKAEDFYTSANMSGSRFQTTCMYDGDGLELSNAMIALYLAVSADGSIRNRKKWSDENYCDISFKKERKKNRLSAILKDLSIPYSRNDNIAAEGYSSFAFRIPKWFKKEIPIEFATKSSIEQKKFILDELVYWDGNRVNGRTQTEYSSKLIHNVTVIQLIAHTCGMMSTIMHRKNQFGEWYQLSILNKSYVTYQKTKGMITSHLDGFVYCVTVPTGMIMVRQNNKISITGNCDQLAAVESGYKNSVSVPLGANNYGWIEENWEWLEQFDSIILAFDNDEAGRKAQKECIYRLGSWRTKIMDIPESVTLVDGSVVKVKDINEMLYYFGKESVLAAILNAKDSPVDSLVDYSDIHEVDLSEIDGIETGIQELDREIMRLFYGTFNILTGINGCVDCETEYFNGRKWKKISEYTSGDTVLQYNKNGTTKLVNPQCYHKYFCNEFYLLKSHDGLVNQKVSPEHNLVLSDNGKIIKINVEEYISKEMYKNKNLKFINTFSSECNIELYNTLKVTDEQMSGVSLMFIENMSGDAANSDIADYIQFDLAKKGYSSIVTNEKYSNHIDVVKRNDGDIYIHKEKSADGFKYCFTVPSGMLVLRRNGRINITGNSGKSSFLSQLVAQSIDQNKDVWMYSKELPNYMLKNWQTYIFAGRRHISEYMAQNGSVYYKVNDGVKRAIDDYYRGHLKIYKDGYKNSIQSIKTSMEDSARKFGSKLFIIDNLTAMNFECNDNEKWSKQVDFINWSIDFAQKYHVVVMLVIHPKKIEAMRRLTKLDVQGLGSIVDLAHRLISLYRVSPKEKMGVMKQAGGGWLTKPVEFDVLLDVLKDRMRGREGLAVGLHYDTPSRRFYTNENEFRHQYRWDKTKYEDEIPYPKVNEPEIFGNKELL